MSYSASRRFLPGEGPSSGLLRDCTTSPINRFAALIVTPPPSVSVDLLDGAVVAGGHQVQV